MTHFCFLKINVCVCGVGPILYNIKLLILNNNKDMNTTINIHITMNFFDQDNCTS